MPSVRCPRRLEDVVDTTESLGLRSVVAHDEQPRGTVLAAGPGERDRPAVRRPDGVVDLLLLVLLALFRLAPLSVGVTRGRRLVIRRFELVRSGERGDGPTARWDGEDRRFVRESLGHRRRGRRRGAVGVPLRWWRTAMELGGDDGEQADEHRERDGGVYAHE